jgi:hypothetical protein
MSPPSSSESRAGLFLGLLALLWFLFYTAWRELPYVRAGAAIVYSAKEQQERQGQIFPPTVPVEARLIVFGNSKTLTGFIPAQFDSLIPARLYSANMGKPDDARFVGDLELLAKRGQVPGNVLVTLPWATAPSRRFLEDDDRVMDTLFPFRRLPRDLILFSFAAPGHGGILSFYRYGESAAQAMDRNRGWYFIEGQSHFPHNRLPDEFHLGTDRPDLIDDPAFAPTGPEFERLDRLAARYSLRIFIVPSYHREGELRTSPPYASAVARRMAGYPHFTVAGPNYLLFPNRYFSDPVHLNPAGAALYTQRLAELMTPYLQPGHASTGALPGS